jgi:hypothetical protein
VLATWHYCEDTEHLKLYVCVNSSSLIRVRSLGKPTGRLGATVVPAPHRYYRQVRRLSLEAGYI